MKGCSVLGNDQSLNADLPKTCIDYSSHFPAGDKTQDPGAGMRSQIAEGGAKWTPYTPEQPGFVFRSGVCGDLKKGEDAGAHMRGGRFYCPPDKPYIPPSSVYTQGGVLEAKVQFATHHNGFMEIRVCDVQKCGGEISESCFQEGHCHTLQRLEEADCESGDSMRCGPIDRVYPTRFYLPCSKTEAKSKEKMTGIKYVLPKDLNCEHCVLQWYYAAANSCNPPGLREYFQGPNKPNWGQCKGQGGARGGYRDYDGECGDGDRWSEEYYSCSDITIKAGARSTDAPTELETRKAVTEPTPPAVSPTPSVSPTPTFSPMPAVEVAQAVVSDPTPAPVTPTPTVSPAPTMLVVQAVEVAIATPGAVEPTPEPTPAVAPGDTKNPVSYVEVVVGTVPYKIRDGESKTFTTGGAKVMLNAVTVGEKPTKVLYKVETYGWKYEYVHPYTYTFPQGTNPVYNAKAMSIRVHAYAQDGNVYVTRFALQLL